jgi:hypothetical protein
MILNKIVSDIFVRLNFVKIWTQYYQKLMKIILKFICNLPFWCLNKMQKIVNLTQIYSLKSMQKGLR